jgi:prepilin-type N-terminal cleavage/methylation domain-containing protein
MRLTRKTHGHRKRNAGFTVAEMVTVLTIGAILSAVAIPQIISQRRLLRTSTVSRELMVQLRYTRQLALSRRAAFTFQYDNNNKQIKVIGPIPAGTAALIDTNYPSNTGSSTILTVPLTQAGLSASELIEGIPTTSTGLPAGSPTIPTGALGDGVSKSTLTAGLLNITFQPDGTVIDSTGAPANKALFFFNNKAAQETATAISVIGASGRVKVWRYTTNGNKYAE